MRWKQTGESAWCLFDTTDFIGMPVEVRVATVRERTLGVTTKRYEAYMTASHPMMNMPKTLSLKPMAFSTLEDAQVWAQTTYRLTK